MHAGALDSKAGRGFGRRLVEWYSRSARDLPWRHRTDAYAIWVSEILLQQTTVTTVLGRYETFLEQFPTLAALGHADVEDVVAAVQGLGYYRRFRLMHRAAQQLLSEGKSELPSTLDELQQLPGLGAYTAGAVASIAFGEAAPAVDGNVVRVLTRHFGFSGMSDGAPARRDLSLLVPDMMPAGSASEFNQALFDVGAVLCTPRSPSCDACPVSSSCVANSTGRILEFPAPKERPTVVNHVVAVGIHELDGELLLVQRPVSSSKMPGFWELPEAWGSDEKQARETLTHRLIDLLGPAEMPESSVARVRHTITRNRLNCLLFPVSVCNCDVLNKLGASAKRLSPAEVMSGEIPVTTVTRKLLSKWMALSRKPQR